MRPSDLGWLRSLVSPGSQPLLFLPRHQIMLRCQGKYPRLQNMPSLFLRNTPFMSMLLALVCWSQIIASEVRPPKNDEDLRYWLENMMWHHRYSSTEASAVTGLSEKEIVEALVRFGIGANTRPPHNSSAGPKLLPYPGGRHPRIGFLDGAVNPQRETKISVFTPWDDAAYVVVDVPEALWSNLGLTYLAHTHIPTVWTKQGVALEKLEWERRQDGSLAMGRKLPNGIGFGALVNPNKTGILMDLWLTNGTRELLTDLRVQNCVMLKAAPGFNQLTNANKVIQNPYVACRNDAGTKWIITAWKPCHRPWVNSPVPCLHSDPKFPDCPPGEIRHVSGWLSFYEGPNLDAELKRLDSLNWDRPDSQNKSSP